MTFQDLKFNDFSSLANEKPKSMTIQVFQDWNAPCD
jgi:hypothetical protein